MPTAPVSRRMWWLFETVHDVVYFSDEVRRAGAELGFKGFWMAYFAFRLAPVGEVDANLGTALCYNFSPRRVGRALPDAWTYATAAQALAGRQTAAAEALRRIVGPDAAWQPAADLLWRAAEAADVPGRPLAAANQWLPRPDDDVDAVWLATTVLREHRGDGHNAVLLSRGVGPVAAHLLKAEAGESDGEVLRTGRGFTDEEWGAGLDDARRRGWIDDTGGLTAAGHEEHRAIEEATDMLAARPWHALGESGTQQAYEALLPLARAVHAAGIIPQPSPVGMAWQEAG